jgi:ribosomal protein L7/L12
MKKLLFIAFLAVGCAATASAQKATSSTTSSATAKNYSVSITDIGTNKPAVIKALTNQLGITDAQAQAMLNLMPGTVKTELTRKQAEKLRLALVAAGATAVSKAN